MPNTLTSFSDSGITFAGRSDSELKRSVSLFRILHRPALVRLLTRGVKLALRLHLPVRSVVRKTIFRQFCGGESLNDSKSVVRRLNKMNVGSILDYSAESKNTDEDFETTCCEVMRIIYEAKRTDGIPYTSIKLTGLIRKELLEAASGGHPLTGKQLEEYRHDEERFSDICQFAALNGVPVYVDAEESWLQPAIDRLTEEMMRRFNTRRALVQTTLQMYRHDRLAYLSSLIGQARSGGYKIGVKLVRGAYLEKENERAARMNYPTPLHKTKADTDRDFNKALEICLDNIDIVSICCGTHNEESTLFLINEMERRGIRPDDPRICFSQLYGMSDNITFHLARAGYKVTKYLPYGPVESVLPYLIRRAEENSAIAGQMGRELRMLEEELRRRSGRAA